jgi:hypothetical protein
MIKFMITKLIFNNLLCESLIEQYYSKSTLIVFFII